LGRALHRRSRDARCPAPPRRRPDLRALAAGVRCGAISEDDDSQGPARPRRGSRRAARRQRSGGGVMAGEKNKGMTTAERILASIAAAPAAPEGPCLDDGQVIEYALEMMDEAKRAQAAKHVET